MSPTMSPTAPLDDIAFYAERQRAKLQSLALVLQMEQLGASFGRPPDIDLAAAKREVLREGGWTDVDAVLRAAGSPGAGAATPGIPGAAGAGAPAALNAIPALLGQR